MAEQSGSARFQALFESVLHAYERNTGITLAQHPLAQDLQSCHTVGDINTLLQSRAQAFNDLRESGRLMKAIKTTVSALSPLSDTASFADAVGLVRLNVLMACSTSLTIFQMPFPPVKTIQASLGILLDVCTVL
jgi:hypothetical protein